MNSMIKNSVAAFFLLGFSSFTAANSLGSLMSGTWTTELRTFFEFLLLLCTIAGVVIAAGGLLGIAMIKLAGNTPAGQRAESIGTMKFFIGTLLGAALAGLSTLFPLFMATAAGQNVDKSSFDRLKSGSIEVQVQYQVAQLEDIYLNGKV